MGDNNIKYLVILFVFVSPPLLYAAYIASEVIIAIAWLVGGLIALSLCVGFLVGLWYVLERMMIIKAERVEKQKQSQVMVVTNNGQTWIRDTNPMAHWKACHLEQRVYSNGQYAEPNPIETQAWQIFNGPKSVTSKQLALPEVAQTPIDLLTTLENEQRVLIKGVSNAGKTNLLQWIVSRKLNYSRIIVIDPHASPDKWTGCKVVGRGSNHDEIAIALDKLIDLMVERYQDIATGKVRETEHSKLTIIVDEWMSIAYECDNAKKVMVRLLTESRKAAFSVYVGSHSDRVASLGLDGKGDLRDGFCLCRLSLINGQRQATVDYGNGEQAATLPGEYQSNGQVIDTQDFIKLENTQPDFENDQTKQIHDAIINNPNVSFMQIAKLAGISGSRPTQNKEINKVIADYDLSHCNIGKEFKGISA